MDKKKWDDINLYAVVMICLFFAFNIKYNIFEEINLKEFQGKLVKMYMFKFLVNKIFF